MLLLAAWSTFARADNWTYWGYVPPNLHGSGSQLATDGTNLYYSTTLNGVYRATLADRQFTAIPLTGFPIWDASTNPNGYAVTQIATTPQGTIVISGSPVNVDSNTVTFNPPGSSANTLPVFYWWDETNQLWHAAAITNKSYPYTGNVGNFSIAPDGSLWTCSGFYPYVYHSTDGGKSYLAIDVNAHVPTNYLPMPFQPNFSTFGEIFSIYAGWHNEVVIGTETGGFLHTTNGGALWLSLDPNFTNPASICPLSRIGDAHVTGLDHYGNFLCANKQMGNSPAQTNWENVKLIGWNPKDGSYFNAASGFPPMWGPVRVLTAPSGMTFCFMAQDYLLEGGVYRSFSGKSWTQFNQGSGLDASFAAGITNSLRAGNCITIWSNTVFIAAGTEIYEFDSTPPPIVNRPPVALPQNVNLWENTPANLALAATDADGDALNFTIITPPARGTLTGTPPDLIYTPSNNVTGLDNFSFAVDDGLTVSANAVFNLAINAPTNTLSTIALVQPADGSVGIAPTNVTLTAAGNDPDGIRFVNFYIGSTLIAQTTNAPYTVTLTNVPTGDYTFSARAIDNFGARTWSAPIRVTVLPVVPTLSLSPVDAADVAVSWPLELDGFFVETATDLAGPWTLSPVPPIFSEANQTATLPLADQQFFRLMRPH